VTAPPPDWTVSGTINEVLYGTEDDVPGPSDPGPPGHGTNANCNFFWGGPDDGNDVHTAQQTIDVSAAAADIDTGRVTFTLSGYFGGYESQDDNSVLQATFLGTGSTALRTAVTAAVLGADRNDQPGLLPESVTNQVPVGTRSIVVKLIMTRTDGNDNDASADALTRSLDNRRAVVADVLAVLQRMGRDPPPAILVRPQDMAEAIRAATLLGSTVEALKSETDALRADLAQLADLRASIAKQRDDLAQRSAALAADKMKLAALVEARQQSLTEAEQALAAQRDRAGQLAEQATNLKDLIAKMESAGSADLASAAAVAGSEPSLYCTWALGVLARIAFSGEDEYHTGTPDMAAAARSGVRTALHPARPQSIRGECGHSPPVP